MRSSYNIGKKIMTNHLKIHSENKTDHDHSDINTLTSRQCSENFCSAGIDLLSKNTSDSLKKLGGN